jgi:adenosine deaminase
MEEFVRRLPKAELHLHLEGTLEPEMMFALAERHGIRLRFDSVEALRAAYEFRDLQSFLDLYYEGCQVLRTAEDFHELTWAWLQRAHADGVVHAEPFFDPQSHTARGVPFEAIVEGIGGALDAAERELGITSRLIMCFLRHLPEEAAMATFEAALPFRDRIVGIGLDSTERGHPPSRFRKVFARAKAQGFRLVAHAGEEGPPDYIRQALDVLDVERIDHGVRVVENPELLERVIRDRVPLTVCPLSNVRLKVYSTLLEHPLRELLQWGACVTINSDDPAYFGGYLVDNYVAAARALALDERDLTDCARNSIRASFLPDEDKARHLA